MKALSSRQPLGLLLLRVSLGLVFFSHGYPKLAHSAAGMQGFFVQHGLPGYFVYIAGVLEVFGAILLVLGLFTRAAALLLAIEMGVAIWKVHRDRKSTRLNSSHQIISYAVFCLKKKK